jgi:hypothetical protein
VLEVAILVVQVLSKMTNASDPAALPAVIAVKEATVRETAFVICM